MSKPDTGDALPYSFDELIPPYDGSDRAYFRQGTPEGDFRQGTPAESSYTDADTVSSRNGVKVCQKNYCKT